MYRASEPIAHCTKHAQYKVRLTAHNTVGAATTPNWLVALDFK